MPYWSAQLRHQDICHYAIGLSCSWNTIYLPSRNRRDKPISPHCLEKEPAERKWLSRERPSPWRTNIYCVLITTYTSHWFQDVWATCQKVHNLCFHPDLFSHVILIIEYLYHLTLWRMHVFILTLSSGQKIRGWLGWSPCSERRNKTARERRKSLKVHPNKWKDVPIHYVKLD